MRSSSRSAQQLTAVPTGKVMDVAFYRCEYDFAWRGRGLTVR